jgi:DNA-directed RNA polymerase alpha subunit
LQVTGTGFSKQSVVNVDGNICPIQTVSYDSITCIVPPSTVTSDKFVIVMVTDGSATSSVSQQFKYDFANTPVSVIQNTKFFFQEINFVRHDV